jgi:hypothetical protein
MMCDILDTGTSISYHQRRLCWTKRPGAVADRDES